MPRGRPQLVNPTRSIHTHIDFALAERLDALLFSEAEGRVPAGAYQRLFNTLLRRFLDEGELDLSPYVGSFPGEFLISGPPDALAALTSHLKASQQP